MSDRPEQKSLIKKIPVPTDSTIELPFETSELRRLLDAFLNREVVNPVTGNVIRIGNYRWGVYSFYDYDGEPIYVGQTKESLRIRIRRHLTNQRTDAVAMNVLDPFEVYKVVVYPLPELEGRSAGDAEAKRTLDALEEKIYRRAIEESVFSAILNEKEPPIPQVLMEIPEAHEGVIISDEVRRIREHPDVRIARRTRTISRLAQVISERKVKKGLRNVLLVQARRLEWLVKRRLEQSPDILDAD
ncbi:TPA: GIY-YIG nuclease family protein [Burkholderia cenocepacia]|nr:GIY-YIG nuclease family protein [Burkholderia cenocepacia]HDR9814941.1 GIY-YIG nuclease family protein [Burkholderia cenocepacia]HDR9817242.1 GIY-YIG nuclease family protein [Burkholderia cenocepacia]HDR9832351.1 GIY-YIG nuclease family protein [Burkholderia cenocepacia]